MKFTKLLMLIALASLLMAPKCAKDSEETYDQEQDFIDVHYEKNETVTKAMAIEDWEMFLKQSQEKIDNAESNIGNLQIRIDDTDEDQKQQWQEVCDFSNLSLLKLKSKRLQRNKQFESELETYDKSVYERNEAFETQFNNEITLVNAKLTSVFEKIRSGYYK